MLRVGVVLAMLVGLGVAAVAPAAAKVAPAEIRAPATAEPGDWVTVRATIRALVPPPAGPTVIPDGVGLWRVTASKPITWIGTDRVEAPWVHRRGHEYVARIQMPMVPGRYVLAPMPSIVRTRPTDIGPVNFIRIGKS